MSDSSPDSDSRVRPAGPAFDPEQTIPTENPSAPADPNLLRALRDYGTERLVFGRFRLVRALGTGGMGVVWLARDERLELEVALKFLPGMVASDREALRDLRREITRGLKLTHVGIVRVYDLHEDPAEGLAAIAMEYIDGFDLAEEKAKQSGHCFDVEEPFVSWVRQLCDVLGFVHEEARVVHRDLKPRNLMLTAEGKLKVADFGISATLSDNHTRLTQHPGASGSPVYMSPQQALGEVPSAADDIYSLGSTLYELLTSRPPFFRGGAQVILHQVAAKIPPPMNERRQELGIEGKATIPPHWEATVAACLAKEPGERPASVRAIAGRLFSAEAARAAQPPRGGEKKSGSAGKKAAPSAPARPGPATSPAKGRRRIRPIVMAMVTAGAVAVLILAAAAYIWLQGGPRAADENGAAHAPAEPAPSAPSTPGPALAARPAPAAEENPEPPAPPAEPGPAQPGAPAPEAEAAAALEEIRRASEEQGYLWSNFKQSPPLPPALAQASQEFSLPVTAGHDYLFAIAGDRRCPNIDLWVQSRTDNTLGKDLREAGDHVAKVEWRSDYNGLARVVLYFPEVPDQATWIAGFGEKVGRSRPPGNDTPEAESSASSAYENMKPPAGKTGAMASDFAGRMAEKYREEGYRMEAPRAGSPVSRPGEVRQFEYPVRAGEEVVLIAAADDKDQDLEMWVESTVGNLLVKDNRKAGNSLAGARWRSDYEGTVKVTLRFDTHNKKRELAWVVIAGTREKSVEPPAPAEGAAPVEGSRAP